MGWTGRATLLAFVAYCGYTVWDIYRATSAPVADGHVPETLEGLSKEELKAIPNVLVNQIDPGTYLNFDVVISQYSALPPIEKLREHITWHLQEKNSLPLEFSLVGTARLKPYSFDEDDDEAEESGGESQQAQSGKEPQKVMDEKEQKTDDTAKVKESLNREAKRTKKRNEPDGIFGILSAFFRKIRRVWRSWRDYLDVSSGNFATLTSDIPPHYRHGNQTLYLHVFVSDESGTELPLHQVRQLTTYMVPEKHKIIKRYLLEDPTGKALEEKLKDLQVPGPALQCVPEFVMVGPVVEHRPLHLPTMRTKFGKHSPFISAEEKTYILPPYVSADISPQDEYRHLEPSPLDAVQPDAEQDAAQKPLSINVMYQPVGYAYWFLQHMLAGSFAIMEQNFGFDSYDMNSLKMTAAAAAKKNSFLILVCIFFFSLAHCFLEIMALQADLSFWRKQNDPSGYFSLRTLTYEVLTEVIIALFLHENDSKLPLFFVCLHILLNLWKINKFVRLSLQWKYPFVTIRRKGKADVAPTEAGGGEGAPTLDDKTREGAEAFEAKCMRNLSYFVVLPLIVGVASYQLIYIPQKGWWSWFITSAAVCCYGLGFVAMTPQLFRNYYLKSVEYMPWRVLFCQFVNTFVDDVAAYVIRMPKMHRYVIVLALFDRFYFCFFYKKHLMEKLILASSTRLAWKVCALLKAGVFFLCVALLAHFSMSVFRDDVVFLILMYQRWLYRKQPRPVQTEERELKKKQ